MILINRSPIPQGISDVQTLVAAPRESIDLEAMGIADDDPRIPIWRVIFQDPEPEPVPAESAPKKGKSEKPE